MEWIPIMQQEPAPGYQINGKLKKLAVQRMEIDVRGTKEHVF